MRKPAYGRDRCEWCNRVLTNREWAAGLAEVKDRPSHDRMEPVEYAQHSYDCENEPRRPAARVLVARRAQEREA